MVTIFTLGPKSVTQNRRATNEHVYETLYNCGTSEWSDSCPREWLLSLLLLLSPSLPSSLVNFVVVVSVVVAIESPRFRGRRERGKSCSLAYISSSSSFTPSIKPSISGLSVFSSRFRPFQTSPFFLSLALSLACDCMSMWSRPFKGILGRSRERNAERQRRKKKN